MHNKPFKLTVGCFTALSRPWHKPAPRQNRPQLIARVLDQVAVSTVRLINGFLVHAALLIMKGHG